MGPETNFVFTFFFKTVVTILFVLKVLPQLLGIGGYMISWCKSWILDFACYSGSDFLLFSFKRADHYYHYCKYLSPIARSVKARLHAGRYFNLTSQAALWLMFFDNSPRSPAYWNICIWCWAGAKHSLIPKNFLQYLLTGIATLLIDSLLQMQSVKASYVPVQCSV